jgi:heme-degrading monooxygenase HmoA
MWIRVTSFEGTAEGFDEAMRVLNETVLPGARQLEGFKGVLSAATGDRSKGLTITFWESEQALTASEEAANQLRSQAVSAGGGSVSSVDRYEVVFDETP